MTITKEIKVEKAHQKAKANPTREQTKQQVRKICYALLNQYKGSGITGHSMFLYDLSKSGATIERLKNKQGKIYGLEVRIQWTELLRHLKSAVSSVTILAEEL